MLEQFVKTYEDDIWIFSDNPAQHSEHVCQVLLRPWENQVYIKLEKSEFGRTSIGFLDYIIFAKGLKWIHSQ